MMDGNQAEAAKRFAELLAEDIETQVSTADVLDVLGTLGLKLVDDDHGDASVAYLMEVQSKTAYE